MRPTQRAIAVTALVLLTVACGGSTTHARARPRTRGHTATTTTPIVTTVRPSTTTIGTTIAAPTTTRVAAAPPPAPAAPVTEPPATAAPVPLLVSRLAGIGSAQQVIAVAASDNGTTVATLTAYERDASGWKQVFGPWSAYIGRNGVAPIGAKREGDGRTPSGVYGFDFMFGVDPDPGVHFPYRTVTGSNIVWDDDPASANYNEWIDTNTAAAGASPEPMDRAPSYLYGAVIAYNDARTPGLGSAIFLHVSHGSSTAGCVSLPMDELLAVLRWLDPARSPRIAIGTAGSLTSS